MRKTILEAKQSTINDTTIRRREGCRACEVLINGKWKRIDGLGYNLIESELRAGRSLQAIFKAWQ